MADNAQKTWLALSLGGFVGGQGNAVQQRLQKTMPCTVTAIKGSMVTVKFELQGNFTLPQITIAVATSAYARIPTQVGDKGYAVPNDYYLGGQTGDGGGTANYNQRSNLSSLVFHHVTNTDFSEVDQNAYVLQGPNGCVIQTMDKSVSITLTPGGVHIKANVTIEGSLTTMGGGGDAVISGQIKATGNVTAGQDGADQVDLQTHTHASGPPPDPGS